MPVKPLITLPDPRLRKISRQVRRFDSGLASLLKDMTDTMAAGPGGVGLAAPQIGECVRAVVVDCSKSQRPCRNHGLLYLINPEITLSDDGVALGREGCLSVPEWVGVVPRSRRINIRFQNADGQSQNLSATGFEARVIQHEIDHLNGRLFIDRVVSMHDLARRMDA